MADVVVTSLTPPPLQVDGLDERMQDWLMAICVHKRQIMAKCQVGRGEMGGGATHPALVVPTVSTKGNQRPNARG